jgi:hypothetical protein
MEGTGQPGLDFSIGDALTVRVRSPTTSVSVSLANRPQSRPQSGSR